MENEDTFFKFLHKNYYVHRRDVILESDRFVALTGLCLKFAKILHKNSASRTFVVCANNNYNSRRIPLNKKKTKKIVRLR